MLSRIHPRKRIAVAAAATAAAVVAMLVVNLNSADALDRTSNTDGTAKTGIDSTRAIVTLDGDPLATSSRTRPEPGKKINFSGSAVKSQRARLAEQRNDFRAWLRNHAPDAKVTGEYDLSLNAVAVKLNGTRLATLRRAPQVTDARHGLTYRPTDANDPDLPLIHAIEAWRTSHVGGAANAGKGVKIGIIDTGIDATHPCFSDAGYPPTKQLGDTRFTNDKVIAARVFHNKAGSRGYTPEAVQDHGTHVAGTAACNLDTPASIGGVDLYGVSGVAPAAQLGNYNVFPGEEASARTEDIVNAMEQAYVDGMDVINMSLGGASGGKRDLATVAVDNLDKAGMVSAVAAGNSGPGHGTVQSPGSAARALTAGASSVGQFIGTGLTVAGATYGAASGDFATVESDLTAPLGVAKGSTNGLDTACSALSTDLTGKIGVISRGVCSFSTKIRNAQNAGAEAVIVVNNVGGDPVAMAEDGTPDQPTVPAYMVGLAAASDLVAADGQSATIGADEQYFRTGNDNIMAGFSSQGPTDTAERRVKPDLVAPGVNVLSSVPHQFCDASTETGCWAFFQGTSMATPHLAGMAAVVRAAHPGWSAEQVRSAIVNTASEGELKNSTGGAEESDVNVTGAGLGNLLDAVRATVAVGPVSTSFGSAPRNSGVTRTATVTLSNLTDAPVTVNLSVDSAQGSGVTFGVADDSVTIPAGDSVEVTLSAAVARGASAGDHSAALRLASGGDEIAHSVLYIFAN